MKFVKRLIISLLLIISVALVFVFVANRPEATNQVTIRLGHEQPENHNRHVAMEHFKKLVEERSNGEIEIDIFPNGILGSDAVLAESVSFNDLEMVATSATTQWGGEISVFELPFLFSSYQNAWEVLDSDVGRKVAEPYLESNLRVLAYFENGFRQITSNRYIQSPEDLKGLKIRTPEFPLSISTYNSLGANPTPMAFSEVYTGLQQGTIDAQENPIANTYANRIQEVQDYVININMQYIPVHLVISDEFYQTLSAEHQAVIDESALESAQFHRDLVLSQESAMIEAIEATGTEFVELPNIEEFSKLTEDVYEQFAMIYGQELVDIVVDAAERLGD